MSKKIVCSFESLLGNQGGSDTGPLVCLALMFAVAIFGFRQEVTVKKIAGSRYTKTLFFVIVQLCIVR